LYFLSSPFSHFQRKETEDKQLNLIHLSQFSAGFSVYSRLIFSEQFSRVQQYQWRTNGVSSGGGVGGGGTAEGGVKL
jgi:hypothetical protein